MSDTQPSLLLMAPPKFALGDLSVTANALEKLTHNDMETSLNRHAAGDWGDLEADDLRVNERALKHGGRLFSIYESENGFRFYIITEANRQYTTILLPGDY